MKARLNLQTGDSFVAYSISGSEQLKRFTGKICVSAENGYIWLLQNYMSGESAPMPRPYFGEYHYSWAIHIFLLPDVNGFKCFDTLGSWSLDIIIVSGIVMVSDYATPQARMAAAKTLNRQHKDLSLFDIRNDCQLT